MTIHQAENLIVRILFTIFAMTNSSRSSNKAPVQQSSRVGEIEIYRGTRTRDSSRINERPIQRCLSLAIKHALRPQFVRVSRQIYG